MRFAFDTPWDSQPQEVEEVDWGHPFFAKATQAWVFVGSQPYSWGKHTARYAVTTYSGTAATRVARVYGRGLESVSTGINHIAPAIQELNSILALGYIRTDTEGSTNYTGFRSAGPGTVSFGNGAGSAGGNRRDWDWTQANASAPYCIVPNATMASAPAVHVSGNKVVATANASPGTATSYGWGGSTTYVNAGSPFGTAACGLFVVVNGQVSDAVAALATAAPWEIFRPRRIWVPVSAGGGGVLVGTSTLSFAPAAVLTGAGAMLASSTLSFAPTATLLGSAALAGSGTLTLNPVATLVAAAILAGSSTVSFAPTAAILGAGALAGSGVVSFVGSGTMLGAGAIAGSSAVSFAPSAVIVGAGALAGSGVITFAPSGTLDLPPGVLVGTSTVTLTATATALGAGGIAGSVVTTFTPAGTVTVAAPMVALATITLSASAALGGSGTLAGASTTTFSPTGTVITGLGSMAGASTLTFAPQATMAAAGALAGSSVISLVLTALMGSVGGAVATQRVLRIAAENRILQIAAENRNLTIH